MRKHTDWELKSRTYARRFPLFMTIKFLLLRTYASFCYRWSYLPKFALSNRNMLQKWKPEELSRANLENATFANLFSSRVFKYYIIYKCGIYQFCPKFTPQCPHFCNIFALSKFYLCKYIFSFSAKTAIIARSNNSHNLWITFN